MPQTVIFMWTALPRRVRDNKLELTAYLSMRLVPTNGFGNLAEFALFDTWPAQLAAAQFEVSFWGDMASHVTWGQTQFVGEPQLFVEIFPPTTPVRTFAFASDVLDKQSLTFDARVMNDALRNIYGMTAADPLLARTPPRFGDAEYLQAIVAEIGQGEPDLSEVAKAASDFQFFYQRHSGAPTLAAPIGDEFEFHERLSLLGDFPELLRRFGICVDLEVDLGQLPDLELEGQVAVRALWFEGGGPVPEPLTLQNRTAYRLDVGQGVFCPAERPDGDVLDGMLRLSNPDWSLLQGELDGAASKLIDLCNNWYPRLTPSCPGVSEPITLPALLSGGFTVIRTRRAEALYESMTRFRDIEDQPLDDREVLLYADDLVRGYRIDVRRNDDPWRSLCRRQGTILLGEIHEVPVDDEGHVKVASAGMRVNADAWPESVLLHEAAFGWDGWSLSARRPGRAILDPSDQTTPRDPKNPDVGRIENEAPPGAGFSMATYLRAAPGTLPRLRFGDEYQLRARVVDLAGNSREHQEVTADHATDVQTYLRFEPVPSPVVVPRARFVEGESLEHVVVRSIIDDDALAAAFPEVAKDSSDRHLAPAKATQFMVETHGLLDPLMTADPAAAYALSMREQGTFLDHQLFGAEIEIAAPPGVPTDFPATRGDPLPPGAYVVHTGSEVLVPYLADPFATGVALRGPLGEVTRMFEGTWPDVKSIRLRLRRTDAAEPQLDVGAGTVPIEVALPPATIVRLDMSSALRQADLEQTWVWSLIQSHAQPEDLETLRALATGGGHWMLTPFRTLELVHAVQKPLRAPEVESATLGRVPDGTWVDWSNIHIDLDAHSTGTVDVTAEWTDEVDTGGEHRILAQTGHAFQVHVAYDDVAGVFPTAPGPCPEPAPPRTRQEIGDTRHHVVRLRATGTTRFREYFPRQLWLDERNLTRTGELSAEMHIPSTRAPEPPRVAYMLPTFEWREAGGDERQRIGGGLRIYLERPWFSTGEGEQLAVLIAAPGENVAEADREYVSRWGHDPIWAPVDPATLAGPMTAAHLFRDEGPILALPQNPSRQVMVLGFPVDFSDERGLWFCDIELDPGTAYFPFVRLAIARYQAHSLTGLELSTVVRADFAQLTANRTATLTRDDPASTEVTLTGPSASNGLPDGGHRVSAVVQSRPNLGSEFLWRDELGGPVPLPLVDVAAGGIATWRGVVPLPSREAGREYQLLITEREVFAGDDGEQQRIVYADAFAI
jgi:hypothetical protein